jgi:hypothetical protein
LFELFQINLNKSKTILFIWARPPRFLLGPAHVRPRAARASLLPPYSHCHRGPPISNRRAPHPGHCRPGHGRGQAPRPDPPLLPFFPLSRAPDRASSKTRPTRHSSTPSSPTPLRPSLSSATSLPTVPAPGPLPSANRGLSLTSDFTERHRCLPPLR